MSRFRLALGLSLGLALFMSGCGGGGSSSPPDSGLGDATDEGLDGESDAASDATSGDSSADDATSDASSDSGTPSDSGGDATTGDSGGGDGGSESGTDAMVDAAPDAPSGPVASFSTSPIDFGPQPCGGAAPGNQTLTLSNVGGAPLTYSASLSSNPTFSFVGSSAGTVGSGGSLPIVIAAAAVPAASTAGATLSATLSLTTDDPAQPSTNITVQMTPQGATFTLSPTTASFGLKPENMAAPSIPLTLTNTGNASATVTFGAPSDTEFGVTYTGTPSALNILAGGSAPGLAATYTPTTLTSVNTSAAVNTGSTPICGTSVTTIPMSGQGSGGSVSISTSDVYFGPANNGLVSCGTMATQKTFTISNTGNASFTWTAVLQAGVNFSFSPASGGTIAVGGMTTVTVTPITGIPSTSATTTDLYSDVLTISTSIAGDPSHPVKLHETASGAILTLGPASAGIFGTQPVNTTTTNPISVQNTGNATANVSLATGQPTFFQAAPPGPTPVGGGTTLSGSASFTPGLDTSPQTDSLALTTAPTDVLCAPLPTPLALSGTGTNGVVAYNPGSLTFGPTNCGGTAPPQSITFSNAGNQAYTITPALTIGTHYTLSMSPSSGVVAANGGTCILTVTPGPIPQTSAVTPDLYGDTLTVTTTAVGDTPHTISISQTAQGAIITVNPSAFPFGSVTVGAAGTFQFGVQNAGNLAGTVDFVVGTYPAIYSVPDTTVPANTNLTPSATFQPENAQLYTDSATVSAAPGTVLCQPLDLTSITLSGTGVAGGVVDVSPTSLTFGTGGFVPCGSTAPFKTVTVTNNSVVSITVTPSFAIGTSYTVSPNTPTAIPAGMAQVFTVTPDAIPQTSAVTAGLYNDTLQLATTAPGNPTYDVALHETAQGAIFAFSKAAANFPATKVGNTTGVGGNFNVINHGNVAGSWTLLLNDTTDFSLSLLAGTTAANGGTTADSATFHPGSIGSKAGTATMSSATGTVLCSPVPAPFDLNGTGN